MILGRGRELPTAPSGYADSRAVSLEIPRFPAFFFRVKNRFFWNLQMGLAQMGFWKIPKCAIYHRYMRLLWSRNLKQILVCFWNFFARVAPARMNSDFHFGRIMNPDFHSGRIMNPDFHFLKMRNIRIFIFLCFYAFLAPDENVDFLDFLKMKMRIFRIFRIVWIFRSCRYR